MSSLEHGLYPSITGQHIQYTRQAAFETENNDFVLSSVRKTLNNQPINVECNW